MMKRKTDITITGSEGLVGSELCKFHISVDKKTSCLEKTQKLIWWTGNTEVSLFAI